MSRTTHAAPEPVDACRYYAGLIVGALSGGTKESLLSERYCPVEAMWRQNKLSQRIDDVASGSFKTKQPPAIRSTGYVVNSLEAALWAFWHAESFEHGILKAVNLGSDADTVGAIYGQLAGAYYGAEKIPRKWRSKLTLKHQITNCADDLLELSKTLHLAG